MPLDAAPSAYETFKQKRDGCIEVVLKPWEESASDSDKISDAQVTPSKIRDFMTPESNPAKP